MRILIVVHTVMNLITPLMVLLFVFSIAVALNCKHLPRVLTNVERKFNLKNSL